MADKTVLISGAGIAGPTLAFWLKAAGFVPTLVERAPTLRTGGYVIDFWGLAYDIAERMGLAGDLDRIGYHMRELRIVDGRGKRVTGFGTAVFRELTGGRYVTLARSDLSRLLFERIKGSTEALFGDEIVEIQEATAIPGLARFAFGRDIVDKLQLVDYPWRTLVCINRTWSSQDRR